MTQPVTVLHVGKSCRAHILAETMLKSRRWAVDNRMLCEVDNPGMRRVSRHPPILGPCEDVAFVEETARAIGPDFCLPGPEEPLVAGVVDGLARLGIPSVGPRRALARLESSKSFTRALLRDHGIPGNPEFRVFESADGLAQYLERLGDFVVKPDGLTGGKGVKVSGDHLHSVQEGAAYARDLLAAGGRVVIEEKLIGEEFTLQSFCDGWTVADMVPVRDHKRLLDGDLGPNTGGMGSYSCADHLLPFLTAEDLALASRVNRSVARALREKTGEPYKGVLYGSFIVTPRGPRVIEYNARFGDPEVMNVLSILETDLVDICKAIIEGTLGALPVTFANTATVCKYVVPEGYPDRPVKDVAIEAPVIDNTSDTLRMYHGAVRTASDGRLLLTGSRAVAFVGLGADLAEAERRAEAGASSVRGPVFHRRDIGTAALTARRASGVGAPPRPVM